MSIGDFPESSSQAILVGVMLVGRLGVLTKIQDLGDFTRGSSNVWVRMKTSSKAAPGKHCEPSILTYYIVLYAVMLCRVVVLQYILW